MGTPEESGDITYRHDSRDWEQSLAHLIVEIDSALDADRWDTIASIIDDYFFALSLSSPETIDRVWERARPEWLAENPRYLMAAAITAAVRKPFTMVNANADRDFESWVAAQASPVARDVLGVKIAVLRRNLAAGLFDQAALVADDIELVILTSTAHDGFDDILPSVLVRIGVVRLLCGSSSLAIAAFSEAWRWSMSTYPHPFAPFAAAYCALVHALDGDFAQAKTWLERCSDVPETPPVNTMQFRLLPAVMLARALVAIGSAERDTAQAALRQLTHGIELGELWWVALHARSRCSLYWGDRARAVHELESEMRAYPSLSHADFLPGIVLRSDLADLHQAQDDFEAGEHALSELSVHPPHPAAVGSLARHLFLIGNGPKALALLDSCSRPAAIDRQPPARWEVLRANLAHLTSSFAEEESVRIAAERITRTRAFDAVFDATPDVRRALRAHVQFPESIETLFVPRRAVKLTPREDEILALLERYPTAKALAVVLFISPNTAKSHLGRLYRKLGVENQAQAVRAGRERCRRRTAETGA